MIKKAFYILTAAVAMLFASCEKYDHAISDIENRLNEMEDVAGRIQSLTFIPRYSDGKVRMNYSDKTTTLDFIVSPAELAHTIEAAFDEESSTIKAFVKYTESPTTQAELEAPVQQTVVGMEVVGSDGMFSLNIKGQNLGDDFWQGKVGAVIYIHISTGSSNFVSDVIPMVAYYDVGNSAEVAIAKFQHYFCDSNGNMAIHPLDEYSHMWAVGTTSGERACEIFSDITGLHVTAQESYTYSYQSRDGRVEFRITGNLTADENAVYATLYVTIPGYEDVEQIKIVTPEYLKQDNADTIIPVII